MEDSRRPGEPSGHGMAAQPMTRRQMLGRVAGGLASLPLATLSSVFGAEPPPRTQMGIVTYALGIHRRARWEGRHAGLTPAVALLEEVRRFGAGGIQTDLTDEDAKHLRELRGRLEAYDMSFEASIAPPQEDEEIDAFDVRVAWAQEAGAVLARTVILPGRRYERFRSLAEFREFEQRGRRSLERAEPVLRRRKFRLAVENHKDQRVNERLDLLRHLESEWIGVCLDFGNSVALLEDPVEVARAFAPWAMTVHLKDQAVREYAGGFLLADVALGDGFLDLAGMVTLVREAQPKIRFNLECITRDALEIPVLTPGYWPTLGDVPAPALARMLRLAEQQSAASPLPKVSTLSVADQLELEHRHVARSVTYAQDPLGI